jgi:hypothetical protein
MHEIVIALAIIAVILQVADYITSVTALKMGGTEISKLSLFFQKKLGNEKGTLAAKLLAVAVIVGLYMLWVSTGAVTVSIVLAVIDVIYARVVTNNYLWIKKYRK